MLEAGAVALALRGSELQSLTRHATALAGVVWLARSGCGHAVAADATLIVNTTSCKHAHVGRSNACAIGRRPLWLPARVVAWTGDEYAELVLGDRSRPCAPVSAALLLCKRGAQCGAAAQVPSATRRRS